ncbi:MAG: hypothetical protein CR217_08525 [Beijerinckiaceae bacterium]|nr:MAG: hypothetical protein CR217_08525 [Beijerinckiaceae bacterium]
MAVGGDIAVGKEMGLCTDMVAYFRHFLPRRLIARKTALLPRNLARFRAEYPRQVPFHAQKCAGSFLP